MWKILRAAACRAGAEVNGDKSGFHGVEVLKKVGSMARKIGEFGFHGVELSDERRLPRRGGVAAGRYRGREREMGRLGRGKDENLSFGSNRI